MNQKNRIAAMVGVVMMAIALLCLMVGCFVANLQEVLWNASAICFLAAVAILLALTVIRKRREQESAEDSDESQGK